MRFVYLSYRPGTKASPQPGSLPVLQIIMALMPSSSASVHRDYCSSIPAADANSNKDNRGCTELASGTISLSV